MQTRLQSILSDSHASFLQKHRLSVSSPGGSWTICSFGGRFAASLNGANLNRKWSTQRIWRILGVLHHRKREEYLIGLTTWTGHVTKCRMVRRLEYYWPKWVTRRGDGRHAFGIARLNFFFLCRSVQFWNRFHQSPYNSVHRPVRRSIFWLMSGHDRQKRRSNTSRTTNKGPDTVSIYVVNNKWSNGKEDHTCLYIILEKGLVLQWFEEWFHRAQKWARRRWPFARVTKWIGYWGRKILNNSPFRWHRFKHMLILETMQMARNPVAIRHVENLLLGEDLFLFIYFYFYFYFYLFLFLFFYFFIFLRRVDMWTSPISCRRLWNHMCGSDFYLFFPLWQVTSVLPKVPRHLRLSKRWGR